MQPSHRVPPVPQADAVNRMFAGIAGEYDRANRIISGGVDLYWRQRLVSAVRRTRPRHVVDLATGSGDVAFALRKKLPPEVQISGLDFCEPMLEQARRKQQQRQLSDAALSFASGDCLNLPLADGCADAVTISFGLRNLEDRARGLREMHRILRPGGHLFVLEFSQPHAWFNPVYHLYLKHVLPVIARLATGNREAYDYLAGTIESFPRRSELATELTEAGFDTVKATALSCGIVALHQGLKAQTLT